MCEGYTLSRVLSVMCVCMYLCVCYGITGYDVVYEQCHQMWNGRVEIEKGITLQTCLLSQKNNFTIECVSNKRKHWIGKPAKCKAHGKYDNYPA